MKREIKRIDTCGIRREEIKSTYMNLMLKRYCINSVFNLGLLSIVGNSWLGVQTAPVGVISRYLKAINYLKKRRRIQIMGGIIFYINERVMMTSIIIEFFKVIKRCIFIEKQKKLNSSAIMIPDLTNTHFNRNEKDSLISRVIKYYEDKLSVIIFYLGNNSCNEDKIINLKEPYSGLRGNRRINTLRITLRFTVRYIKCMLIGNTVE